MRRGTKIISKSCVVDRTTMVMVHGYGQGHGHRRLQIGVIYVTAPTEEIYKRVQQRAVSTGRAVPIYALKRSLVEEVPKAVERLRSNVDFFLEIYNPEQQQQQQQQQQSQQQQQQHQHQHQQQQSSKN